MVKTVILCGGKGTRLKEETEFKPKPMVDIGGMPVLWHIMKCYSHHGFRDFVLPLGYRGDMIKEFFIHFNWKSNNFSLALKDKRIELHQGHRIEDWHIDFVDTGQDAGTGLRLFRVKGLLEKEDHFMLTYGDGLSDVNLKELERFHRKQGTIATITGVHVNSRFGRLKIKDNKVVNFQEKPMERELVNGGFMVFNRKVFDYMDDRDSMLEEYGKGILPKLAEMGEVSVYNHKGYWTCMDTYRDYLLLNKAWREDPKWRVWK